MANELQTANPGISRNVLILGGVMWTAAFVFLFLAWKWRRAADLAAVDTDRDAAALVQPPAEGSQPAIQIDTTGKQSVATGFPASKLPDFEFEECMGGTVSLEDLKGRPWVASMIFTRCATTCPMISAAMMRLHNRVIEKNPDVMLVTFTVHSDYDDAEVLQNYSETFQPDRSRWKFLTGDQQEIHKFIMEGFRLYVKQNEGDDFQSGFEVAHSNRVVLVNEDGIPVGTFLGTRDGDMSKLSRILLGRDEFPQPGPSLSFSTTDGSPLNIQFDLKPAESPDETDETDAADDGETPAAGSDQGVEITAGSEEGADATDADATANDAEADSTGDEDAASSDVSAAEHNRAIDEKMPAWSLRLPSINAGLNTLAAFFLFVAWRAIKNGNKTLHRNLMITAFITSVVFLACYLTYHYLLGEYTGARGKKFPGEGLWKTVYFAILIPHVILAAAVPLMALRVFQLAFRERWDDHKRLARITFPIWMFVSVTGVVIYGMLYHWPWPAVA